MRAKSIRWNILGRLSPERIARLIQILSLLFAVFSIGSSRQAHGIEYLDQARPCERYSPSTTTSGPDTLLVNEALLSTRFSSLEELKKVIQIEYDSAHSNSRLFPKKYKVRLKHCSNGRLVTSVLESGVNEDDFRRVRDGNFSDKVHLALRSPYAVFNKKDLTRAYYLGRRKPDVYGVGFVAFYDLAEASVCNITDECLLGIPSRDTSEKGYINTFNHVTAQALMTSLFSETMADYIADVHERFNMPELITGRFTPEQFQNPKENPIDNYADIINNEWGQELGKLLKKKYKLKRGVVWTPELLANYLNDTQDYYSWAFQVEFIPFRADDDLILRFTNKINSVMQNVPE